MTPTERLVAHKVLLVDDDDAVCGGMGSERGEQAAAVGAAAPAAEQGRGHLVGGRRSWPKIASAFPRLPSGQ